MTDRYSTWTTADGKNIAIKNMSTDHLHNTIKMLQKRQSLTQTRIYSELVTEYDHRRSKDNPNQLLKEIL